MSQACVDCSQLHTVFVTANVGTSHVTNIGRNDVIRQTSQLQIHNNKYINKYIIIIMYTGSYKHIVYMYCA